MHFSLSEIPFHKLLFIIFIIGVLILVGYVFFLPPEKWVSPSCTLFEMRSPVDNSSIVTIMKLNDKCLGEVNQMLDTASFSPMRGVCDKEDCVALINPP